MQLLIAALAAAFVAASPSAAESPWLESDGDVATVTLYYAFSPRCPHCAEAAPFVRAEAAARDWLRLVPLDVTDPEARARLAKLDDLLQQQEPPPERWAYVPAFFFCGQLWLGFESAETTGAALVAALERCRDGAAADSPAPTALEAPAPELPGGLRAEDLSLPALALTLGLLDAFNPCAFFVLLFLLSLMVHAKSRARMLLVGGTFVLFSGLLYFAFMAAWLNAFLLMGQVRAVTVVAGAVAVALACLNLKDFFVPGSGPSLSIPESRKPGLFRRMRALVGEERTGGVLVGTVTLAIAANTYELLCTVGFPMVFTRALTLAEVSTGTRYAYLALYNVVYVLPLAAIVGAFVFTLGSRKLSEMEGRLLKLLSGAMMLGLGVVLLVAPAALTRVSTPVGLLLAALAVTAVARVCLRRREADGAA